MAEIPLQEACGFLGLLTQIDQLLRAFLILLGICGPSSIVKATGPEQSNQFTSVLSFGMYAFHKVLCFYFQLMMTHIELLMVFCLKISFSWGGVASISF